MERADVPEGFIRLSDAAHRLERGVWGCQLAKPVPLQAIKPSDLRGGTVAFNLRNLRARKRKLGSLMAWGEEKDGILVIRPKDRKAGSLGFGPWKEEAGKLLRAAAIQGQLGIYVSPDNEAAIKKYGREPLRLPCDVLQRMIPQRGSLPDHAIRCSLKLAGGDSKVFDLLRTGVLLVHTKEFVRLLKQLLLIRGVKSVSSSASTGSSIGELAKPPRLAKRRSEKRVDEGCRRTGQK